MVQKNSKNVDPQVAVSVLNVIGKGRNLDPAGFKDTLPNTNAQGLAINRGRSGDVPSGKKKNPSLQTRKKPPRTAPQKRSRDNALDPPEEDEGDETTTRGKRQRSSEGQLHAQPDAPNSDSLAANVDDAPAKSTRSQARIALAANESRQKQPGKSTSGKLQKAEKKSSGAMARRNPASESGNASKRAEAKSTLPPIRQRSKQSNSTAAPKKANENTREEEDNTNDQQTEAGQDDGPSTYEAGEGGSQVQSEAEAGVRKQSLAVRPTEKAISKILEDFEDEAQLHGCRLHWAKMLIGAKRNKIFKSARTDVGNELVRLVQKTKSKYRGLSDPDTSENAGKVEEEILENLDAIEVRCSSLSRRLPSQESEELLTDIYLNIIPSMVSLLKVMVKTRFKDKHLDSSSLDEISHILSLTRDICYDASNWDPGSQRPKEFPPNVVGDTRNAISVALRQIKKAYDAAKRKLDLPRQREDYHERWRERQKQYDQQRMREKEIIQARLLENRLRQAAFAKEVKAIEMEKRRRWRQQQQLLFQNEAYAQLQKDFTNGHPSSIGESRHRYAEEHLYDIDEDLVSDWRAQDVNVPPFPAGHELSAVAQGKLPERPRPPPAEAERLRRVRERTEDLPSPPNTLTPWSDDEVKCLLTGLEQITGPDRFEEILDRYGGPGGWLERRDLDDLMAEAKFLKATYESELKRLGRTWEESGMEWLQSVPG